LVLFLSFGKYFIQIQHQKVSLGELLSRLKTPTSFHSGPPNRTECDAYKSFLYTYQVFLHNRWSQIFYLIQLDIPSATKLRILFFLSLWEVSFTGTKAILGSIYRFSNPNRVFVTNQIQIRN
jgi:hypothetical protein